MEDLIGQTLLDRYRVEEFVGRGGMAEVYRAYDTRRRITVALKFLREDLAEDEVFLRRFRREAKVLETLQHPNIVRYYGLEESDGLHFLVVEFIDGEGLRKKLSRLAKPLTLAQTLAILEPVCNALHYAHAEGIYHCDIKPANIMIDNAGRVVVADFGIARLAESATLTSATTGTPAYMAPEQCRGQTVDARTDIYALAITTFEMLTLDRPFTGEAAPVQGAISERIRWEQLKAPAPSPRKYNPEIDEWADAVILKALEKPRNRRFVSVLTFYDALTNAGRVVPDPLLPWTEGEAPESASPTLAEPFAPEGSTRGGLWEQRVNDALWALRRTAVGLTEGTRKIWNRIRRSGSVLASVQRLLRRAVSIVQANRPVQYGLAALLLLAVVSVAIWGLTRPRTAATQPTVMPTIKPLSTQTAPSALTAAGTRVPQSTPSPARSVPYLTVSAKSANIRNGPATVYTVVAVASTGDQFDILARSPTGDWYNVCCAQGKSGWIHTDLVDVFGDAASLPMVTPAPPSPQQIGATSTRTRPTTTQTPQASN